MRKTYPVLLAFVVFLPTASMGADFTATGVGMLTCAEFGKAYAQNPKDTEQFAFTWAEGFMSGLNAARISRDRVFVVLNSRSVEDQETMIREYCDAHPLKLYEDAVKSVYFSMPTKPYS